MIAAGLDFDSTHQTRQRSTKYILPLNHSKTRLPCFLLAASGKCYYQHVLWCNHYYYYNYNYNYNCNCNYYYYYYDYDYDYYYYYYYYCYYYVMTRLVEPSLTPEPLRGGLRSIRRPGQYMMIMIIINTPTTTTTTNNNNIVWGVAVSLQIKNPRTKNRWLYISGKFPVDFQLLPFCVVFFVYVLLEVPCGLGNSVP